MFKLFSKITLLKIIGSTAIVFSAIFFLPNFVLAASSGPNNPGTAVDDSSVGSITWSNPTRVVSSNNSYATASLNDNQISHYIKATNFGFAIPAGAVINGITVEVEKNSANASRIQDYRVRIVKGGVIGSTDKSNPNWWGTTDAYATYGSSTELWGQTWTVADINSANFGLAFSAYKNTTQGNAVTASVDHIRITITYTPNTAPNAPTLVSPANGSYTNNNKPTLSANYSDPDAGTTGTTNYRIAISAVNCTGGTVVSSGTSATTASNNQNTTWTPATSIGSDATYYWCAQNNDGFLTSAWTSMGNFILDTVAPTNTISAPSASITNTGPITYTITYSGADSVTLANGNVTLNGTGTATGTIAVTGTGTSTRTVTISSITGNGTLGISIAAGTASDLAGNTSLAAGPSTTFSVDNIAPTLSISAPSVSSTQFGPVIYTISYTGADLVVLSNGNVTLNGTGTATGTIAVTGTGTSTRTVTISSISGDGTLGISIAGATASDTAGNSSLPVGPSATFSVSNSVSTTQSTVSASPATLLADGLASSTVTVTLLNINSNPVSGKIVTLSKTSGPGTPTITTLSGTTNASGTATFAVSSVTVGTDTFTATDVTDSLVVAQTVNVTFTNTAVSASSSTVLANPTTIVADGIATSTVAVVLNDNNNNPVSGKTVTLAKTSGPGTPNITTLSGITDASGIAMFTVSSVTAGTDTFTATDATDGITITQTANVTFTPGAVNANSSTVVASPSSLVSDGVSSSTVSVNLKDIYNNPISGKIVTLAQTSGTGTSTITTLSGTTNASGTATFAVSSVTVGTDTFTATDITDALVIVQTTNITFSTDVVSSANSSVVASPTSVLANGTSTSMITVILEDNHNNPVSGKLISLAVTSGPGSAIITPVMDITDASGTAQFTVSSDVPGTYIFTATDVTDSLVISQTASVVFFITSIPAPRSIPLSITISGRAYPGAQVSLYEKTPSSDNFIASSIASSASGDFTIRKSGIPPGQYDYFLQAKDKNNNLSQIISYSADLSTNRLAVNTVLVSPTLSLTRSYLTRGDFITAIGYAAQNSTITLFIDNNKPFNVDADNTGNYKLLINTAEFDYGTHSIKAKQYDPSIGLQSDLSPIINFTLVKSLVPGTDYNGDGKVDIQDFSSFLSLWQNKDMLADLNHDGKVDIQDWSIFLKSVTIR